MAAVTEQCRLVSEEGTGVFYVTTFNPKNQLANQKKLRLKKYDWKLRKHVWFKQEKIK